MNARWEQAQDRGLWWQLRTIGIGRIGGIGDGGTRWWALLLYAAAGEPTWRRSRWTPRRCATGCRTRTR